MRQERIGIVQHVGPYDLPMSLRVAALFNPNALPETPLLRTGLRVAGRPIAVEVEQIGLEPALLAVSRLSDRAEGPVETGKLPGGRIRPPLEHPQAEETLAAVARMTAAEIDLRGFYDAARPHKLLGRITRRLFGVKPFRPRSLVEMLVVAVTEQQISLAAAYRIRERLVAHFGGEAAGIPVFPSAHTLAAAGVEELMQTGLSRRKAEYVQGAARAIESGGLDDRELRALTPPLARQAIMGLRGFGPWSADYVLVRYLGSVDTVPLDDLGVQNVVGGYLGNGRRMSPEGLAAALEPFTPFRGLAVFYMLAHHRLTVARGGHQLRPQVVA